MATAQELLDRLDRQGGEIRAVVQEFTQQQLRSVPVVGKWSIQQLIIHLADADAAFMDRMRRLIAEDEPVLMAWDQDKFAQRLFYDEQSVEDAIAIIELGRRQMGRILRKLAPDGLARAGRHSERGRQTLSDVLINTVGHVEHHMPFLLEKCRKLR